jgi:hypothetical protein
MMMSTTYSKMSIHQKFCYQQVYCYLIRYLLLSPLLTAANNFDTN